MFLTVLAPEMLVSQVRTPLPETKIDSVPLEASKEGPKTRAEEIQPKTPEYFLRNLLEIRLLLSLMSSLL